MYMRSFRRKFYESHMSRSSRCHLGQIYFTGTQRVAAFILIRPGGMMKAETDHRKSRQKRSSQIFADEFFCTGPILELHSTFPARYPLTHTG